jgi:subtilisin family serine protease
VQDGCLPSESEVIQYPASHWRVLAVGASDANDKRQTRTNGFSPAWDSRYGSNLSVVAPGVLIRTTDLGGGYDANGPGFTGFIGTSAAAPHVAGLAALILSLQPDRGRFSPVWLDPPRNGLTNYQVSRIIEESAEKVGGYTYHKDPLHPWGSWNSEMGYGRINVANALRLARDYMGGRELVDYSAVVM